MLAKEKGCWAEQMVFGFLVRAREAERVGDRPLQPEGVRVAPTPQQTWPWVWREREGATWQKGRWARADPGD